MTPATIPRAAPVPAPSATSPKATPKPAPMAAPSTMPTLFSRQRLPCGARASSLRDYRVVFIPRLPPGDSTLVHAEAPLLYSQRDAGGAPNPAPAQPLPCTPARVRVT